MDETSLDDECVYLHADEWEKTIKLKLTFLGQKGRPLRRPHRGDPKLRSIRRQEAANEKKIPEPSSSSQRSSPRTRTQNNYFQKVK